MGTDIVGLSSAVDQSGQAPGGQHWKGARCWLFCLFRAEDTLLAPLRGHEGVQTCALSLRSPQRKICGRGTVRSTSWLQALGDPL